MEQRHWGVNHFCQPAFLSLFTLRKLSQLPTQPHLTSAMKTAEMVPLSSVSRSFLSLPLAPESYGHRRGFCNGVLPGFDMELQILWSH